ncbi:hypothetical protein EN850_13050 [Mesorhizobium sp. M8A.F.Ca.ET.207.01.1.1]|nr:hypothetical protein EN850_13050 [Mesorhizobium sp. M8A.F.Ca.ET.207.01.1.1]TIW88413.1 MAG: hypothetical protein E5V51_08135 [Mesorhizobium sp.]
MVPKTESNGARNEFYNKMGRATSGDRSIGYMGRIIRLHRSEINGVRRHRNFLESRGMISADLLDTTFPFDPDTNRASRPAPAEAIFVNPTSFGLRQSESLPDRHTTEAIQIENGGLIFQNQDAFEAGAPLTVLKARILRDVQQ